MINDFIESENLIIKLYQYGLFKRKEILEEDSKNELFSKIFNLLPKIDTIICNSLFDYTIDRISYLDLAILRLATYHLLLKTKSDNSIFNEAIELTKSYSDSGDDKQKNFNHSLLNRIKETIKNAYNN